MSLFRTLKVLSLFNLNPYDLDKVKPNSDDN